MNAVTVNSYMGANQQKTHRRQRRPFFRRIGPYLHLLIVVGVAAPIVVYLSIMQTLGWRMPVLGTNGVFGSMSLSNGAVLLYTSPQTQAYFKSIGGNYDVLLTPWREYLRQRTWDVKEINDTADLVKHRNGVLILASAVALGDQERRDIQSFQEQGGAVLTTWATGTRKGNGDWDGWKFLRDFGVSVLGEIAANSEANHLIVTGESPLSHTLPAGQRIFLVKTSEPIFRFKAEATAAQLMGWARIVDPDRREEGAAVYAERSPSAGRVAAFAFAESTWESHPLTIFPLLDDTLKWLQRDPSATLAAWPQAKRSAQVIEMDTEEGFANAFSFATMARAANVPASFYVLSSVAKLNPDLLRTLARDFDMGYHGDIHIGFKGQAAPAQERRLMTMRADLTPIVPQAGAWPGFRAPTEGYDATTEQLLHKLGFKYHVADPNRTDGRLPLMARLDGVGSEQSLVVLPRTQRDDLNLHWERLTPEQTSQALIDDAMHAHQTGSLALLSIHSQNFGSEGVLARSMPTLLNHLRSVGPSLWLASGTQVAQWWRNRERVKLSTTFTGKRLEMNITIRGDQPVQGASIIVYLPYKGGMPSVSSTKIGATRPAVNKLDDYRVALVFDELKPGNHAFQATFE